ncbi:hypothetical protein TZ00_05385 [Agreia bicolorata]|uniref:HTH marR-type domain-containing protein n=1 Tax=Agreia bicolorata TaxID=110935 RepID=A0ABR5CI53_9MICO|nr:hypothetical protein TZ00_05385 [Agreia bicolorata]
MRLLLRRGPLGRSEMARMLGVSRANLTRVTRELLAAGLVREGPTELRSAMGRPVELLQTVPDAYHFVGVKITGEALYAVVVNLSNVVVASLESPLRSREPVDVEEVVDEIAVILDSFGARFNDIAGLGIALAGTISGPPEHEIVYESTYLGWDGVALADLLRVRLGLPVTVGNEVQALTLTESLSMQGHPGDVTMALVTVGVGIGVGYVIDGALIKGASGRPGRLNHLIVDPQGPLCDRGHRGCVASYLTNESIAKNSGFENYDQAIVAARAGDASAVRAFVGAGRALGDLLGTVVNAVDPGVVILTGDGLALHEIAADAIGDGIARTRAWNAGQFTLDVRAFDFSEWARAAAVMSINLALTTGRGR